MRFGSAVVAAITMICAPAAASSGENTAIDRLESLNRMLSSRPGWTSEFRQEHTPVGMTAETADGRVWLAWPDRALFHTGDPPHQLMGLAGRTVRLIDLDVETCNERELSDREWERVPMAAVLDPRGALVHFTVVDEDERGVVLIPKEPGGVDRVEVVIGGDGLPAVVVIRDPQGAVNRLVFSGWRPSDDPPGGAWLPDPPEAVECVADPGPLE
jgi:hypothetical protein